MPQETADTVGRRSAPPLDVARTIDEYLRQEDWRVNANANQGYSLGGLILNSSGKMIANYWLSHVYPETIGQAHRQGDLHIHDLDMLAGFEWHSPNAEHLFEMTAKYGLPYFQNFINSSRPTLPTTRK